MQKMRLFRVGRMINRLLLLGILVGCVLLIFMRKADESFLNKVRVKIGAPTIDVVSELNTETILEDE